eukprot:s2050_g19.t1
MANHRTRLKRGASGGSSRVARRRRWSMRRRSPGPGNQLHSWFSDGFYMFLHSQNWKFRKILQPDFSVKSVSYCFGLLLGFGPSCCKSMELMAADELIWPNKNAGISGLDLVIWFADWLPNPPRGELQHRCVFRLARLKELAGPSGTREFQFIETSKISQHHLQQVLPQFYEAPVQPWVSARPQIRRNLPCAESCAHGRCLSSVRHRAYRTSTVPPGPAPPERQSFFADFYSQLPLQNCPAGVRTKCSLETDLNILQKSGNTKARCQGANQLGSILKFNLQAWGIVKETLGMMQPCHAATPPSAL